MKNSDAFNPAEENVAPHDMSWTTQTILFANGYILSLVQFGYSVYFVTKSLSGNGTTAGGIVATLSLLGSLLFFFVMVRWSSLLGLSYFGFKRHRTRSEEPAHFPYVSIFVPCYNEGETISLALESLLELNYPAYEVLVVNDGSTDDTLEKAKKFEGVYGGVTVRVLDKPNGGKWSAHNLAFHRSSGELIMCVDADTRFEPNALRRMVVHFEEDPKIAIIAGQTRVRNQDRLIGKMQNLEYQIYNGVIRLSQNVSGCVLCVPGPLGLFRRTAMEEVCYRFARNTDVSKPGRYLGPFESDTFSEDFDLSSAILSLSYKVVYEPHAIAYTNVPPTLFTLINQRYRWYRGNLQVIRKLFKRATGDPVTAPPRMWLWTCVTYFIDISLVPIFMVMAPVFYILVLIQLTTISTAGYETFFVGWIVAVLAMGLSLSTLFLTLHREKIRFNNVIMVILFDWYSWILIAAGIISIVDEIRDKKMKW